MDQSEENQCVVVANNAHDAKSKDDDVAEVEEIKFNILEKR